MTKSNSIITFTIDGETFTVEDKQQTAAALLRLAGLNPAEVDLVEHKPSGTSKTYRDEQQVTVKDGDVFLSLRQTAPVA